MLFQKSIWNKILFLCLFLVEQWRIIGNADKANMLKCPETSLFPISTLYCTINLMPKSRGGVIMNFQPLSLNSTTTKS